MTTNLTVETFKKVFNINVDLQDVWFQKLHVEPYTSLRHNHEFGEKMCLLYQIEFIVFNINITLRILAFKYENHAEILKLEIKIGNEPLSREIAPCRNFLQRRRNLNLTFEVLLKFLQLFESRRLICLTVLGKYGNIRISDDEGVVAKCYNQDSTVKYLEFTWSILWKLENYEVSDFIEFYFNYRALEKELSDSVKEKLEALVEAHIEFHTKLKLWKSVLIDIYGNSGDSANSSSDVLEISDSESEESVIEIDKGLKTDCNTDEIMVIE